MRRDIGAWEYLLRHDVFPIPMDVLSCLVIEQPAHARACARQKQINRLVN
jgi:hypothetical protein